MCPACIATSTWLVAGGISASGIFTLLLKPWKRLRKNRGKVATEIEQK